MLSMLISIESILYIFISGEIFFLKILSIQPLLETGVRIKSMNTPTKPPSTKPSGRTSTTRDFI